MPVSLLQTTYPNFKKILLPVAVAWFPSDDSAIRYVLPVLWTTSCFSHNGTNGDTGRMRVSHRDSPDGAKGKVCSHRLLCLSLLTSS